MSELHLIVARGKNGAIGLKGKMPWHLPEDLKHFKETTMGAPVIMGRKTWESIGRALPGRVNVVLTRDVNYVAAGAKVVATLGDALELTKDAPRAFIIGGAHLYRDVLERGIVDCAWVTEIDASPQADAFFPELSKEDWERSVLKELPASDVRPKLTFCRYDRRKEK